MGQAFWRLGAKAILWKAEQLEQVDTMCVKGQPRHQADNQCTCNKEYYMVSFNVHLKKTITFQKYFCSLSQLSCFSQPTRTNRLQQHQQKQETADPLR